MKILVSIFLSSFCFLTAAPMEQLSQYALFFSQSLADSAAKHLKSHVGDSIFKNRIRFYGGSTFGKYDFMTAWSIEFANGQEMRFGVPVNKDGTLAGEIPLPRCAVRPETCELQLDFDLAVTTAESTLNETFIKNTIYGHITYEYSTCDCFVWFIHGAAVTDVGWSRGVTVEISDVDGSIIWLGRSQEFRNIPSNGHSKGDRRYSRRSFARRLMNVPDERELAVDRATAIAIAESTLGDLYCGGGIGCSAVYQPEPFNCIAWQLFSCGPDSGDGWHRCGDVKINAVDGSIILIARWEEWKHYHH